MYHEVFISAQKSQLIEINKLALEFCRDDWT